MIAAEPIVRALVEPACTDGMNESDWDIVIRQGRRANLLARLAVVLGDHDRFARVPEAPRHHLSSALRMVERQAIAMRWEVECIRAALADVGVPIVLLKGAAYLLAGLPVARGRVFSDVDILVPREHIVAVESALRLHGWRGSHENAHDQRYYREWMHEIPPMHHVARGTAIDVHHSILPLTARIKVNTPALFDGLVAVPGQPGVFTLPPTDMLLHSATHLFHEGEFANALRDLFDLDCLFREAGKQPDFWARLVPRATELGLARPLFYAIRYAGRFLDTPVPPEVKAAAEAGRPPLPIRRLMDDCYAHALRPVSAAASAPGTRVARAALYLRSHWIRMPVHLLLYHLGHKALRRPPVETPRPDGP